MNFFSVFTLYAVILNASLMKKTLKTILITSTIIVVMLFLLALFIPQIFTSQVKEISQTELVDLVHDGDLIFQTSTSAQSKAIQKATQSKYSHMGLIYKIGTQAFVYEAVQPVKITPLNVWVNRGYNGQFVVKRLKDADQLLTPEVKKNMVIYAESLLGKNYDVFFEWSDKRMYCSEVVWKIYKKALNIEIGELQQFKDFDLSSKIVQQELTKRYGNNIPQDELVITPIQMFKSQKLVTVYSQQ